VLERIRPKPVEVVWQTGKPRRKHAVVYLALSESGALVLFTHATRLWSSETEGEWVDGEEGGRYVARVTEKGALEVVWLASSRSSPQCVWSTAGCGWRGLPKRFSHLISTSVKGSMKRLSLAIQKAVGPIPHLDKIKEGVERLQLMMKGARRLARVTLRTVDGWLGDEDDDEGFDFAGFFQGKTDRSQSARVRPERW